MRYLLTTASELTDGLQTELAEVTEEQLVHAREFRKPARRDAPQKFAPHKPRRTLPHAPRQGLVGQDLQHLIVEQARWFLQVQQPFGELPPVVGMEHASQKAFERLIVSEHARHLPQSSNVRINCRSSVFFVRVS